MYTYQISRYAIFALLFWIIVGCQNNYTNVSFVKVEPEHTKLIDGIESYQSINELEKYLSHNKLKWEMSQNNNSSPKGRPPYNIATILIKNYSHLSFSGKLEISFFNNRLTATTFYPVDIDKYFAALAKKEGIKFDNNDVKLPPYTRVRSAMNPKGQKYVDWSDIRLDKEIELWIKRYS